MNDLVVFFANYAIYLLFLIIPILWLVNQRKLAGQAILSAGLAWLIGKFIKDLFYLPRPFIVTGHPPLINFLLDGTFPSGHSLVAFAISFVIYRHLSKLGAVLLIISGAIALSRVISGVHYPMDVFAGAGLGIATAWALDSYHSK